MTNKGETDALYEAERLELPTTHDGRPVESFDRLVRSRDLERVEVRNRILKLRRQGFSSRDISMILLRGQDQGPSVEISERQVRTRLSTYVAELRAEDTENADVLREIDTERLQLMFRRLEADASSEDPMVKRQAILAQLRVLERFARLHGLDQTKLTVEGDVNHNLIADPKHVAAVDEAFRKRHGGKVIELPASDVAEEVEG
jgi:DNA-binding transcriptional MerR regulator